MSTWNDKPNDYDHAIRLLARCRAKTIEECARRLEAFGGINGVYFFQPQIDAIRALKSSVDTPPEEG